MRNLDPPPCLALNLYNDSLLESSELIGSTSLPPFQSNIYSGAMLGSGDLIMSRMNTISVLLELTGWWG